MIWIAPLFLMSDEIRWKNNRLRNIMVHLILRLERFISHLKNFEVAISVQMPMTWFYWTGLVIYSSVYALVNFTRKTLFSVPSKLIPVIISITLIISLRQKNVKSTGVWINHLFYPTLNPRTNRFMIIIGCDSP